MLRKELHTQINHMIKCLSLIQGRLLETYEGFISVLYPNVMKT